MPVERRAVSAVLRDFLAEFHRLENFDAENQRNFARITQPNAISKKQLFLLTEAIYFSGFRAYENFIRDIFLLYCMRKKTASGKVTKSFVRPRNFQHAENLIKSSMPFLDWSSPDRIIQRSELYLDNRVPIKDAITNHIEALRDYKKIRNHIAHNSIESLKEYKKVLLKHYAVIPLTIPAPGEFLLQSDGAGAYKLLTFFTAMRSIASSST